MQKYKINYAMSAYITAEVLKEIITKQLESDTGKKVEDIKFDIAYSRQAGMLHNEMASQLSSLKGVHVTFKVSDSENPYILDKDISLYATRLVVLDGPAGLS